jgi:hypothetical protein
VSVGGQSVYRAVHGCVPLIRRTCIMRLRRALHIGQKERHQAPHPLRERPSCLSRQLAFRPPPEPRLTQRRPHPPAAPSRDLRQEVIRSVSLFVTGRVTRSHGVATSPVGISVARG